MKKRFHFLLTLLLFVSLSQPGEAQIGNFPANWNWQILKNDSVRIIFPEGLEKEAYRVANITKMIADSSQASIGKKFKPFPIILQNHTTIPNGYVGIAPFRSEFFMTPPQNPHLLGTLPFKDLLAVHEYRHGLQYMQGRQGLSLAGYILIGQNGQALLNRLATPNWFWEGDAVVTETAWTPQGRGRIPAFLAHYRSQLLNEAPYSYQKAENGSLKDRVPDHYRLGYLMCSYGREKFGNNLWSTVFKRGIKFYHLTYPFSKALKKQTGYSTKSLYWKMMTDLEASTKKEWEKTPHCEGTTISPQNKRTIINFQRPIMDENGNLIVFRNSYKETPAIIRLTGKKEKTITRPGMVMDSYFSYSQGRFTWSEFSSHPRRARVEYSNLWIYDEKRGKKKQLTHRSRLFSPAWIGDSDQIVAVEVTPDQKCALVILNSGNGDILNKITIPDKLFISYPQPFNDGFVALTRNKKGQNALTQIDAKSGKVTALTPWTYHILGIPSVQGNSICFSGSFTGIDNIFLYEKGQIKQLTSVPAGAYQPFLDKSNQRILFSNYHYQGDQIKALSLKDALGHPLKIEEPAQMQRYQFAYLKEEGGSIFDTIPTHKYTIKPYRQGFHLLNPHSWYWSFSNTDLALGITSNNVLNTLQLNAGVTYNLNEESTGYNIHGSYGLLFPIIDFAGSYQNRSLIGLREYSFKEKILKLGLRIPLNISSGQYNRQLTVGSWYNYTEAEKRNIGYSSIPTADQVSDHHPKLSLNNLEGQFTFLNALQVPRQGITSRFGQYLNIHAFKAIDSNKAYQILVEGALALPGLAKTHSIELEGIWRKEPLSNDYFYQDNFTYSRGYNPVFNDNAFRMGATYHFPIAHPDFGFRGLFYIKRFRANLFTDLTKFQREQYNEQWYNQRSHGFELVIDATLFNTFSLPIALRCSYRKDVIEENKINWEVVLPVTRF